MSIAQWFKCLFGHHTFRRPRKLQDQDFKFCVCGARLQIKRRKKKEAVNV